MLRHPDAMSPVADFGAKPGTDTFQNVLPDHEAQNTRRVLVCTGKIGHNLRVERAKRKVDDVAIVFLEQLYPWPEAEVGAALGEHKGAREVLWVQEEPANMGALLYVRPKLEQLVGKKVRTIKRTASASPATGSGKAHELEEKTLLDLALGHSS